MFYPLLLLDILSSHFKSTRPAIGPDRQGQLSVQIHRFSYQSILTKPIMGLDLQGQLSAQIHMASYRFISTCPVIGSYPQDQLLVYLNRATYRSISTRPVVGQLDSMLHYYNSSWCWMLSLFSLLIACYNHLLHSLITADTTGKLVYLRLVAQVFLIHLQLCCSQL